MTTASGHVSDASVPAVTCSGLTRYVCYLCWQCYA